MAEVVADMDQVSTRTTVITRQSADVNPRLRTAVFQEAKPASGSPRVGTVVTDDQKYIVYQLTGVTPGRPESIPLADRDEGKLQLALQSGSYDLAALISALEKQADIVRSEDALSRETLFE